MTSVGKRGLIAYALALVFAGHPELMQTFFPNIPVATPTTFLVNVNTLEALPLLQGATDAAGFMARVDTVLQMYGGKKGAK